MVYIMKVVSSLKTLKIRDRNCQIVKRRGRLYVINKRNPRFKARQGQYFIIIVFDHKFYINILQITKTGSVNSGPLNENNQYY